MRISEYDRIVSPSDGDLFVVETLEGTKTIAYEDMNFVSKSSTESISGIKTFTNDVIFEQAAAVRSHLGLGNTDGAVPIGNGGTGATTAALARTALGIGAAGTLGTPIPINRGGTGATTAALVRNALGLGNTTGALPIANGGTAGTTAALARTNLGIGAAGTLGTPISVNRGGTGGTTAALARSNLGLGAAATCSTTASATSGSTALVTSGCLYNSVTAWTNFVYGGASYTGNIDAINAYTGYLFQCTSGCRGTKPNSSAEFLLLGRSRTQSSNWGFQLALTLNDNKIYTRVAPYKTGNGTPSWGAWRSV